MEDDNRSAPRHRIPKAATISFGGGAISCTVRNHSATGASLGWRRRPEFPTLGSSGSATGMGEA